MVVWTHAGPVNAAPVARRVEDHDLFAAVTETERQAFEWAGAPAGWTALLLLALLGLLLYGVVWLYAREARAGASNRVKAVLASLRIAALVILAVIALDPTLVTYLVRNTEARVAVLVDASASMSIDDGAGRDGGVSVARYKRVCALLESDQYTWLTRLAQQNELALYTFGGGVARIPWPPEMPAESLALPAYAGGGHTDLSQAVREVLSDAGDAPIAGLIVFTDGVLNRGFGVEEIASLAQRAEAAVHTVGVGDRREPPNVRVTNLAAPATVPLGDPFELRIDLALSGVERARATLEIYAEPLRDDSDASVSDEVRLVSREALTLDAEVAEQPLLVSVKPDAAGKTLFRASLTTELSETVTSDNTAEATVLVLDQRLRVLLVAGSPSYEYRYLTRLLERDQSVGLSCWLQAADPEAVRDGDRIILELPRQPEDLFAYDAILLLDPNPAQLDSAWALNVRRFVDEFGGGLLYQAGPHYAPRFLRDGRLAELTTILPITPDPDADLRLSERGPYRDAAAPMRLPTETQMHPVVALHPDTGVNRAIWEQLPGVWWYLPVLRAKSIATVLLEHADPARSARVGEPILLAVQPVGTGRTGMLAMSSTWRWRSTAEAYYTRFWVQMVRYLSEARRQSSSKRGRIMLDREAVEFGDFVRIEARVLDERFVPWQAPRIGGELVVGEDDVRSLTLVAIGERPGWFEGRFVADFEGAAAVRIPLPGGVEGGEILVKRFRVQRPDIEMRTLALRADALERLADLTGGTFLPLDEAAALPDQIRNARRVKVARGPAEPLWDRGWVLLLLVGVLGVEWTLRRRYHLL